MGAAGGRTSGASIPRVRSFEPTRVLPSSEEGAMQSATKARESPSNASAEAA